MVQITEELIRKRAEHNDCVISTLEEVSLHQQDLEKIENIDKWCRDLKILYLQSNLIPQIENVGKLKKLQYLNLALNNVERIENLEGCESLQKLDLTVNFVGELTSIESLKDLYNLKELFLTGNPCTEYVDYKEYVIATLPQLKWLDGVEIHKSERIKAMQILYQTRPSILQQQTVYRSKREQQKREETQDNEKQACTKNTPGFDGRWYTDINSTDSQETIEAEDCDEDKALTKEEKLKLEEKKEKQFWEEKVAFTPESRIKIHKHMEEKKKKEEKKDYPSLDPPKRERRLQTEDGRILNVNEAGVKFLVNEDDAKSEIVVDVAVYKYMDTSLCDVDVQPTYVRLALKGKILQLVLPTEVKPDSSSAKRSQTTGHLIITMPMANPVVKANSREQNILEQNNKENVLKEKEQKDKSKSSHEKLEVDPRYSDSMDFANIVKKSATVGQPLGYKQPQNIVEERPNSEDFIDDPDVPPLI